ncbi:MAG TPA: hypothetical protein VMX57_03815 [Planctomycetota bacterium]|nr:hypothetical protein [Planctomycetota bacterium]
MSLQDWFNNQWLRSHTTSRQEVSELLSVLDRNLTDCRHPELSVDARFNFAYQAAMQTASIALRACGFLPSKGGYEHFRTIQSLTLTMQTDSIVVDQLDRFRGKRSTAMYECAGTVSEAEAREMIDLAFRLREELMAWLRNRYPRLLT